MIELELLASGTAATGIAHERAPAPVALPDGTLNCGGDMSSGGRGCGLARPRLRSRRELALLQSRNGEIQQALEHPRQISRGDLMPEQLLYVAQLVVGALPDRELQRESLRRERGDLWSRTFRVYPPRGG